MSLKEYQTKRKLKKSPEPSKGKPHLHDGLNFCVQRHAARHLHYDFRLEYQGILLSWAIPKGPSLDPHDKRLAVHVEDHPLDYQYFEGTIPKGSYGAGTVEIWDRGTYTTPEASTRKGIEKYLTEGLKKGHFAVILRGEKLEGEFVFQKLKKDPKDKSWLLIKKEDPYAKPGKTKMAGNPLSKPVGAIKRKMAEFIPPMLATSVDEPFNSEDWLFEIKWDGYRALAFINHEAVQLKSRTKQSWNKKFPLVVQDLEQIKGQAIFDGELVVLDPKGKSQFQLMQNYQKEGKGALFYYVFDLLYKDGYDLRQLPLIERKKILKQYLKDLALPLIRFSDHVITEGKPFFKEALKAHLEGIIGKKLASSYQSKRSREWVKIKTILRQEVVIGGFTAPRGSRKNFGALLVGVYNEKKQLVYAGHVGGGFDVKLLQAVHDKLKPLIQKASPFEKTPKPNAPVTWVKPKLVCEVSFTEWTQENIMRHPIFYGLRIDKHPQSVTKEALHSAPIEDKKTGFKKISKLSLTNLDKLYWPKEKYTKGDLLHYYESVASMILPYLKDRPIMLHRFPNGIEGKDFYQKDLNHTHPDWIKTYPIQHEGKVDHYLFIPDVRSLLYAVNLGSIDLHPFISRYKNLAYPDYCVIDLDPHGVPFDDVIETALTAHHILDEIKAAHYCKTSGGNGLHIYIPLQGKYDFDQSRQFAELIALCIHKQLPRITSMERDPGKRQKKVYLDCLQNRSGQTVVAPYCVRPRPHALVSTPLHWQEVNKKLDPNNFNINTMPDRLKEIGDIFKPVLKKGVNLKVVLDKLKRLE